MNHDLIFFPVTPRKWKEWQKSGYFEPAAERESNENSSNWIQCYSGSQVETAVNRRFSDRKAVFLLVINSRTLTSRAEMRDKDGEMFPMVKERINLDSIIDKIKLKPNEKGVFEIDFEIRET